MTDPNLTPQQHKELGISLFNHVWELMDKTEKTRDEEDEMLSCAYASRYHWGASHPPVVNIARGEWLISRVWCVLKRPQPALLHAQRSLDLCLENQIGDFDLAFGYEALARASKLAGEPDWNNYLRSAKQAAEGIADAGDKKILLEDLDTI